MDSQMPEGPPESAPAAGGDAASGAQPTTDGRTPHRGWVRALIAVATVLAIVSTLTTWVNRQALDTDNWVRATDELLDDPDVQQALADFIVNELYSSVDVEAELSQLLPDDLQGLAGPASAALRQPATEAVIYLLGTNQVQTLWETANREAHTLLVGVLEDDLDVVSTSGGDVTLNLGSLVTQLGEQLGLPEDVLSKIPADAGTIEVAQSSELASAQTAVQLTRVLSVWLFLAVVALYALAVFLSVDRRVTVRTIGWSLLGASILILLVRRLTLGYVLSMVESTANEPPVKATFLIASSLLAQIAWAGIAYALLLIVWAIYAGPSAAATAVRRAVAPALNADRWAVWGAALACFALLAILAPTPAFQSLWSATLLLVIYACGIEALRRRSQAEFPDEAWDDLLSSAKALFTSSWQSLEGLGKKTPATASGASGSVGELERLAELHRAGSLSDDEYATAKAGVLRDAAPPTAPPSA